MQAEPVKKLVLDESGAEQPMFSRKEVVLKIAELARRGRNRITEADLFFEMGSAWKRWPAHFDVFEAFSEAAEMLGKFGYEAEVEIDAGTRFAERRQTIEIAIQRPWFF